MGRAKGSGTTPSSWKPGQSGNPAGRPPGARSLLADAFWRDLHAAWQKRGAKAISQLSDAELAKLAIQAAPREVKMDADVRLGFAEALAEFSREYSRRAVRRTGGVEDGT